MAKPRCSCCSKVLGKRVRYLDIIPHDEGCPTCQENEAKNGTPLSDRATEKVLARIQSLNMK